MILSDFHIHTLYCDGKNEPEEIVQAAISRGMKKIGFSGHSYTSFDEEACMSLENTEKYKIEINRLKKKYCNEIEILCGIEQDYYSDVNTNDYDFVIGSVHYIDCGDKFLSVDNTPEELANLIHEFHGDVYSMIEKYFALVADVVKKTGANIIGHFDLVTKFNREDKFFDENHERYINASNGAIDALIKTGALFEINTGALYKGYRDFAYPSKRILNRIAEYKGRVILSSDSHDKNALMYKFQEYEESAKSLNLEVCEL